MVQPTRLHHKAKLALWDQLDVNRRDGYRGSLIGAPTGDPDLAPLRKSRTQLGESPRLDLDAGRELRPGTSSHVPEKPDCAGFIAGHQIDLAVVIVIHDTWIRADASSGLQADLLAAGGHELELVEAG